MVLDPRMMDEVNSNPKATWVAGENQVFVGKTMSQIRHMFGAYLLDKDVSRMKVFKLSLNTNDDIPKAFNSSSKWSNCDTISNIRNQGQCGSCWAFAGAEVLSDRFCVETGGKINHDLSPQDMVSCDKHNFACQGGYLDKLWTYLEETGIVSENCFPYKSGSGVVPECPTACVPAATDKWVKHHAVKGKTISYADVESAQKDMLEHGPIMTGFKVYRDFMSYKSGVYKHLTGGFAGGHAVKIVGWGVDSKTDVPYWIVNNSWGKGWGLNGTFWIERGNDECDFESNMIAGYAEPPK